MRLEKNGIYYDEIIIGNFGEKTGVLITLDFDLGFPAKIVHQTIRELEAEYEGTILSFRVPWKNAVAEFDHVFNAGDSEITTS